MTELLSSGSGSSSIPEEHDVFPQRLDQFLRTNAPLPESESELTRSCISHRRRKLSHLQRQHQDIEEQLAILAQRKNNIQAEITKEEQDIAALTTLLSLSRSLPPEILRSIFVLSLPSTSPLGCHHSSTHLRQAPLSLTQVCRYWRQLALNMPELWTTFSVRTFKGSRLEIANHEAYKAMIGAYFSRSGNLPKTLDFHFGIQVDEINLGQLKSLVACAFDGPLVQNLTLSSLHIEELLRTWDSDTPGGWSVQRLKMVESLILRSESSPSEVHLPRTQSLSQIPRLRRLCIEKGPIWTTTSVSNIPLPWEQLTHVAITQWVRYSAWLEIFSKCTNLQEAIFYVTNDDDPDITPNPHVAALPRYPDLTTFTLIYDNKQRTPLIFQPYRLPSLTNLRLGAFDQPATSSAFDWRNLASQIFNISILSLYHLSWEWQVSELAELLLATPNLVSLTLGISTDYDQIFERFQIDWNGKTLLPRLETLSIDCIYSGYSKAICPPLLMNLTSDGFSGMVKDRWRPLDDISQLKQVSLFLPKSYSRMLAKIRSSLKPEVREGLDLTVETAEKPQWRDPFLGSLTHWHEGLVLPEESDCATCLEVL